ncbi:hypothetical protein HR060_06645 [Catenovulum sp. SM1970]|uniref:ATP-binding protein n=1 Tax=Marinifaba aquimaris TaxID=2741323 RepID=UPI0015738C4D|nr:ATP-binding protein [Marinifaba aquimaris]NTS76545.1 hypothetical protein [Marinifaba aquimaris]
MEGTLLAITPDRAKMEFGVWQLHIPNFSQFLTSPIKTSKGLALFSESAPQTLAQEYELVCPQDQQDYLQAHQALIEGQTLNICFQLQTPSGDFIKVCKQGAMIDEDLACGCMFLIADHPPINLPCEQKQKLDALTHVARPIAHDFNNILNSISGHIEILQLQVQQSENLKKRCDTILKNVQRGLDFNYSLASCGRAALAKKVETDLNEFLPIQVFHLKQELNNGQDLSLVIKDALPHLEVDPEHLIDALKVLISNASHALEPNGNIELQVDTSSPKTPLANKPFIHFAVKDSGHGIKQAIKDRIFAPFASDKVKSLGAGLGLSFVHNFIKAHNGYIEVDSSSTGTQVSLFIPTRAECLTISSSVVAAEKDKDIN